MRRLLLLATILTPNILHAQSREYDLVIENAKIAIGDKVLKGMNINGQVPAPILEFNEGEEAIIRVKNNSSEDTSLHWHGLLLPAEMDGVPGLNGFGGIKPNESFTYKFKIRQSGTYWYHSHSNSQEARGLYGALIIHPKAGDEIPANTILLSDFSAEQPAQILNNLKAEAGYYNKNRRTIMDFAADAKKFGLKAAANDRLAWGKMRMDPTDIADVTGYDFLINGKKENLFFPTIAGQKQKLRIINGAAMTYFDLRIPNLKMTIIAADGRDIEPVEVDELRIAVAETYDILITPQDKAYNFIAESMDRSGQVMAKLAPDAQMQVETNPIRPRAILTMKDMGMAQMDMSQMDHSKMSEAEMAQMHAAMAGGMAHGATLGNNGGMDGKNRPYGWGNEYPTEAKVLNYSDLKAASEQIKQKEADREIIVRLGGNMEKYIWTINGQSGENIPPINLKYGERVKIIFINESMMAHPMHLHGMFVELNNGQEIGYLPQKHIVSIPPGQTYSAYLTADEIGEWSFHCHLLNHMVSGMMTKVVVAKYDGKIAPIDTHNGHAQHGKMMHGSENAFFHRYDLEIAQAANQDLEWATNSWSGTDNHKLYVKGEGEANEGELALLYGRKIADFWDFQTGVGTHFGENTFLISGFHGLAPYNIETDMHLLLGNDLAHIESEFESKIYLTQKFFFEPFLQSTINLKPNQTHGRGIIDAKYGLRLNYRAHPKLIPYMEYGSQNSYLLKGANQESANQFKLGIKFWF